MDNQEDNEFEVQQNDEVNQGRIPEQNEANEEDKSENNENMESNNINNENIENQNDNNEEQENLDNPEHIETEENKENNNEGNEGNFEEPELNQNREEFLEKFQGKRTNKEKHEHIPPKKRWDYLYSQSKLQRMKFDGKRQKKIKEKETEIFAECTFAPKINKNKLSNKETIGRKDLLTQELENAPDSYARKQNAWAQKRKEKIETMKKNKTNKEFDECFFTPAIVNFTLFYFYFRILLIPLKK